jgi:2-polyprenyl-6-methoxyphenol hydroxylase-like FAD-dependent oxidoreductase
MKTINKSSKIAIIGGGISGLALAILLKQKGYRNLKVFEKDESF